MQPGESLTRKTVGIPTTALKAPHDDWIAFLADTERGYAEEMRDYLKKDLHVKANIICSQISWGGLTGLNRETKMEFADNHSYWQHPSFPHKAWDANDWNIPNTPIGQRSPPTAKAGRSKASPNTASPGKPYTISEYNHPAPSDYRAEMMPEYAHVRRVPRLGCNLPIRLRRLRRGGAERQDQRLFRHQQRPVQDGLPARLSDDLPCGGTRACG